MAKENIIKKLLRYKKHDEKKICHMTYVSTTSMRKAPAVPNVTYHYCAGWMQMTIRNSMWTVWIIGRATAEVT